VLEQARIYGHTRCSEIARGVAHLRDAGIDGCWTKCCLSVDARQRHENAVVHTLSHYPCEQTLLLSRTPAFRAQYLAVIARTRPTVVNQAC